MRIEFEKVVSKNFCAVGNQPLTVRFEDTDNTLVIGTNGAGKTSTTIEALVYGLYNKPYRKIVLGGLINTTNKNNSEVNVYFRKGSDRYRVRRGQKPAIFEIYKNDELIEPPAAKADYQAILENDILGMDFKVFSQVVVLNKSRFTPFMDLSTGDRRYIVEEFLDINIVSKMMKVTKDRIKELKNEIANKDNEYFLLEKDVDKLESLIEYAESKTTDSQKKMLEEIQGYKEEIAGYQKEIEANKEKVRTIIEAAKELVGSRDLQNEKRVLTEHIQDLKQDRAVLQNDLKRCKEDALFFSHNQNCPKCKQVISEEFSKKCLQEIKATALDIGDSLKGLDKEIEEEANNLSKVQETNTLFDGYRQEANNYKAEIKSLENSINTATRAQERVEARLREENAEALDIENEKQELATTQSKLDELVKVRNDLNQDMEDLKAVEAMLKEDGVKADIIRKYIPVINEKVNEFLGHMNLNVNFMLDEEFNESVMIPGKEKFTYYNFSDGQKTRIDLALLLTWIHIAKEKNSVNTNLLILDEILEALDINGIHDFLNTIKYTFEGVNLFVISQRKDEVCDCFKNQLQFELRNGFTQMVGE